MVEWDGTVLLTTPRLLLRRFRPDDLPLYAALAHEHWGHGYATEAATGWMDHAFGPLGLPRVISITDRPNLRSLAVIRRLGMEFDHEAEIEDMGQVFQAVVYSITAERWRSARRR
jgi:RimJ/RimL family protein N-acetyltransferase